MHRLLLAAPLLLLACAAGPEPCRTADAAARELRRVDLALVEARLAVTRGYALEREVAPRVGLSLCSGGDGLLFCTGNRLATRTRPVPVDPLAARRALENLEARQAALLRAQAADAAACAALRGA